MRDGLLKDKVSDMGHIAMHHCIIATDEGALFCKRSWSDALRDDEEDAMARFPELFTWREDYDTYED